MTGLREFFEEAVDSPSPPSRLLADEVYAMGRRRRRRRLATATAASATAVATVAAVAVNLLAPAEPVEPPPVAGRSTPAGGVDPHAGQPTSWAGATDANHLYQAFSTCTGPPCKSRVQLTGSDDGGRTWSDRGAPMDVLQLAVLGAEALIAVVPPGQPSAAVAVLTSTDGARTWAAAQPTAAVDGVPDGSSVICLPQAGESFCTLRAVNPGSHQIAPLAAQPPLKMYPTDLGIEESGGRLWVGGVDPATGRPAVAASADSGRTWSRHVFADAPPCPPQGCESPSLAVGDGTTAYAVTVGDSTRVIYRGTAGAGPGGAGWQRLTGPEQIPSEPGHGLGLGSFVAADGTHVVYQLVDAPNGRSDVYRFWAARAGGAYQPVELTGLPDQAGPIRRTPDGWFYALSHNGALYGSTDGWHWSPLTRR